MPGYIADGHTDGSSAECETCGSTGIVPDSGPGVALAAACGALPGEDCPNCGGTGVLIDDTLDAQLLAGLADNMTDDLARYLDD